ncbi:alpha/beta hydrolase [Aliifodinibius sp. S!AR15-10]|uniref:alpha/beta hydrolase n=1 Tax=Aliifodinibius sp. S!AR15-10 TaxID=2950437 RepID=UPI00285FEED0|nr:alpha/beta hydrolase [Aliifodinibius sp. S!AR15-10]MDR8393649.1 alpha/beta hydrolase [Aliifodinibius sp. S!AR15-10]
MEILIKLYRKSEHNLHAMYLISSRKDMNDGRIFAEKDRIVQFGGLGQGRPITKDWFLSQLSSEKVLVLVHGFNNPFLYAVREFMLARVRIQRSFGDEYEHILGYTWPSGSSEFDYFHAKRNTGEAGNRFRTWLRWLTKAGCTIDIMGHSMAALVGYKALREEADIRIRNLFSLGAAIPTDILLKDQKMGPLLEKVHCFYAFHNRNDSILKYGFRLVEWKKALGYAGPSHQQDLLKRHAKINVIDCSGVVQNHTDYLHSPSVLQLISQLLKGYKIGQHTRLSDYVSMPSSAEQIESRYAMASQI